MYDNNFLAKHLRQASLERDTERFATLDDGQEISYGALFSQAERMASVLIKSGVQPGDRVAVQVEKSIQAVELYLGVILAGGVFLPLNTAYTATEIEYFLSDAEPTVFVCDPASETALAPVATEAGIKTLLTLALDGTGSLTEQTSLEDTAQFIPVVRAAEDMASILYTSGTTGRSKGAMISHGNLVANASTLAEYWQFTSDDVLIHALPIFHIHGLYVAINVTLMAGSSLIYHNRFDAAAILADMSRATVLMGVPTFYVRLLTQPDLNKTTTANIRLFVSGSAPLLSETHDQWKELTGHDILERYGMTETNMNTSNPYDGARRAGTVGYPLPGVEVIITDPATGERMPVGETGSVEVRGPNVFAGYWRMPEKTAEELRPNGFFITGDLGFIDDQGYLSIVGRSKDLIISGGYNIYPKELEILIDGFEGVVESAIIGLPHADFGEGVAAVIVRTADNKLTENEVMDQLENIVARFKQPKNIYFVDELPRNTMGKVQKNILRSRYQET